MPNTVQLIQMPRLVLFLMGIFAGIGTSHYLGVDVATELAAPLLVVLVATQIISAPKRIPPEETND